MSSVKSSENIKLTRLFSHELHNFKKVLNICFSYILSHTLINYYAPWSVARVTGHIWKEVGSSPQLGLMEKYQVDTPLFS